MSNLQKQDLQMTCQEIIDLDSKKLEYVAIVRDGNGRALVGAMGDNQEDVRVVLLRECLLKGIKINT